MRQVRGGDRDVHLVGAHRFACYAKTHGSWIRQDHLDWVNLHTWRSTHRDVNLLVEPVQTCHSDAQTLARPLYKAENARAQRNGKVLSSKPDLNSMGIGSATPRDGHCVVPRRRPGT